MHATMQHPMHTAARRRVVRSIRLDDDDAARARRRMVWRRAEDSAGMGWEQWGEGQRQIRGAVQTGGGGVGTRRGVSARRRSASDGKWRELGPCWQRSAAMKWTLHCTSSARSAREQFHRIPPAMAPLATHRDACSPRGTSFCGCAAPLFSPLRPLSSSPAHPCRPRAGCPVCCYPACRWCWRCLHRCCAKSALTWIRTRYAAAAPGGNTQ